MIYEHTRMNTNFTDTKDKLGPFKQYKVIVSHLRLTGKVIFGLDLCGGPGER